MPSLADCNSIFQLAVGVNAVLPRLFSGFERTRDQAGELFARKIGECRTDFVLKECDRSDFMHFVFASVSGLRHARTITRTVAAISIGLVAWSLGMLVMAAVEPTKPISLAELGWFVVLNLIAGPTLYMARNALLRWLYELLSRNADSGAQLRVFSQCAEAYIRHKRRWEELKPEVNATMAKLPWMLWRIRWLSFRMMLQDWWFRVSGR